MTINLLKDKGTPLEQQKFTWKELVQPPYSKLDDDAFTRVRVILMNGIESEAIRFSHACSRMNRDLQLDLAQIRRIEQHQQTLVNWLNPHSISKRHHSGLLRTDGSRPFFRLGSSPMFADRPLVPCAPKTRRAPVPLLFRRLLFR